MSKRLGLTALAVGILLAGCSGDEPEDAVGLTGIVLAGPTCPVGQDPPDPSCEDRPVTDAVLIVVDADGREVAEVRSGGDGRFVVALAPGEYVLEPQPVPGLLGTAERRPFTLVADPVDLVVVYDTGIRSPVPGGPSPP